MRDGPLFPRGEGGGGRDWEKIVCMRKIAEINCLHSGKFGEFKKNSLHSEWRRKKFASVKSMVEKNFLRLENHPRGEIMVRA